MIWEMYYVRGGKCGHWLPRWPIRLMGEENGGVDVPMLAVGECFLTFGDRHYVGQHCGLF